MNRSRMIGGSICLAVAVLLAVLTFTLPEGTITFMVDGTNRPMVPVIVMAALGSLLLGAAIAGGQKTAPPRESEIVVDPAKAALNKRLETIGWGCFLIMLGGFALVPDEVLPKGLWSIGVGVIMLGLNVARYFNKIKLSSFTTFLGIISLVSGVLQLLGMHTLEGAILLIVLGAYLVVKPWFEKRQLFGRAEES